MKWAMLLEDILTILTWYLREYLMMSILVVWILLEKYLILASSNTSLAKTELLSATVTGKAPCADGLADFS